LAAHRDNCRLRAKLCSSSPR
jgi:hypothetical protein